MPSIASAYDLWLILHLTYPEIYDNENELYPGTYLLLTRETWSISGEYTVPGYVPCRYSAIPEFGYAPYMRIGTRVSGEYLSIYPRIL